MTIILTSEYACQVYHYLKRIIWLFFESYDQNKSYMGYPVIKIFDKGFQKLDYVQIPLYWLS